MQKQTILESANERYNFYQGRMVDNLANIIYFTKRKASLEAQRDSEKVDTPERAEFNKLIVSANGGIERAKENVEQDQMLLDSFSEYIDSISTVKR